MRRVLRRWRMTSSIGSAGDPFATATRQIAVMVDNGCELRTTMLAPAGVMIAGVHREFTAVISVPKGRTPMTTPIGRGDCQKARTVCIIGVQPFKPVVYGVKAPL
jgi:hypothetical protein